MSKQTKTIRVHPISPSSSEQLHGHAHHGVAKINVDRGLVLYNSDGNIIAMYQDHSWASFTVEPETSKTTGDSTGANFHFEGTVRTVDEDNFVEALKRRERVRQLVEDFNNDDFD